ncbi:MAG: hypothetical protein Q9163_005973, partial [Psora crenata]
EPFLMNAKLTLAIPKGLSFQQGATLGVGIYTACLSLLQSLKLKLLEASSPATAKDETGSLSSAVLEAWGSTPCRLSKLWVTKSLRHDLRRDSLYDRDVPFRRNNLKNL